MDNIFIRNLELPPTINGVTVLDNEGDYNVYINTLLSYDTQQKTAKHEIRHIMKEHFYDFEPVIHNELEANAG